MGTTTPPNARLRAVLAERGVTQSELAKKIDLTFPAFNKRMNGRVDWKISELVRIARLLNADLTDLIDPEDTP